MNSTHYRAPINFTDEVFTTAISELNKIYTSLKQASLKLDLINGFNSEMDSSYINKYLSCLANDLNISDGLTVLYDVIKELNSSIRVREIDAKRVSALFNSANYMLDLIGINKYTKRLSDEEKSLYYSWNEAKSNKDFAKADALRQELISKGIL